jgi:hypothetical protein
MGDAETVPMRTEAATIAVNDCMVMEGLRFVEGVDDKK